MIGSVTSKSSVSSPNDDPDKSVQPFAYWWDPVSKKYVFTTDIEAGNGNWVASVRDCYLDLEPMPTPTPTPTVEIPVPEFTYSSRDSNCYTAYGTRWRVCNGQQLINAGGHGDLFVSASYPSRYASKVFYMHSSQLI